LQSSLLPLYEQGQACFVPFAGSNDLSRSHFETQDSIELGQPQEGGKSYQSGFLNRLTRVLQADSQSRLNLSPMAFTAQLPLCLRGSAQVANMALASVRKTAVDEQRSQIIASMYQGSAWKPRCAKALRYSVPCSAACRRKWTRPGAMPSVPRVSAW
jgi:uncharacterized protein (DUF1501 family)